MDLIYSGPHESLPADHETLVAAFGEIAEMIRTYDQNDQGQYRTPEFCRSFNAVLATDPWSDDDSA